MFLKLIKFFLTLIVLFARKVRTISTNLNDILSSDAHLELEDVMQVQSTLTTLPARTTQNVDLNSLNVNKGIIISVANYTDANGFSLAGMDINRDGYADFAIGVPNSNNSTGYVYVEFGKSRWKNFNLTNSFGFLIKGENSKDSFGYSVSNAGDFNGDGFEDITIGAPNSHGTKGSVCVMWGNYTFVSPILIKQLTTAQGFCITGKSVGDFLGTSVSSAGDINKDGYGDIAICGTSTCYSVLGKSGKTSTNSVAITSLMASKQGYAIYGISSGSMAELKKPAVSNAGDVNGDGYGDFMIGANAANQTRGITYVVLGKPTNLLKNISLSAWNSDYGIRIFGYKANDYSGSALAASNVNGDNCTDLIISAPVREQYSGIIYVVLGHAGSFQDVYLKYHSTNSNGFVIVGGADNWWLGFSVAGGKDINGDGVEDVVVGSLNAGTRVFYGNSNTAGLKNIYLNQSLSLTKGFEISGLSSGFSVGMPGDVNGDGYADVLSGYPYAASSSLKNVYLILDSSGTNFPTSQPTSQPSRQPSRQPTIQPTEQPSRQPSTKPTTQPISQPTVWPTNRPTVQPTGQPSGRPSAVPTTQPSSKPSEQPTHQPTIQPTEQPSRQPSTKPTTQPTIQPTEQPSEQPSSGPSGEPTGQPSSTPSGQPSPRPSEQPTNQPIASPSSIPSTQPSIRPSGQPTNQPSGDPSSEPTNRPSGDPTMQPSDQPTERPSQGPSGQPSSTPSERPSSRPSEQPTTQPIGSPSSTPSNQPSARPSRQPTIQPSGQPSRQPSGQPSRQPTKQPNSRPSARPTNQPSGQPSSRPSRQPTRQPIVRPSNKPSTQPTTQPTWQPNGSPSGDPTAYPTNQPSQIPTGQPSSDPSSQPIVKPSRQPTRQPTQQPSSYPTSSPTRMAIYNFISIFPLSSTANPHLNTVYETQKLLFFVATDIFGLDAKKRQSFYLTQNAITSATGGSDDGDIFYISTDQNQQSEIRKFNVYTQETALVNELPENRLLTVLSSSPDNSKIVFAGEGIFAAMNTQGVLEDLIYYQVNGGEYQVTINGVAATKYFLSGYLVAGEASNAAGDSAIFIAGAAFYPTNNDDGLSDGVIYGRFWRFSGASSQVANSIVMEPCVSVICYGYSNTVGSYTLSSGTKNAFFISMTSFSTGLIPNALCGTSDSEFFDVITPTTTTNRASVNTFFVGRSQGISSNSTRETLVIGKKTSDQFFSMVGLSIPTEERILTASLAFAANKTIAVSMLVSSEFQNNLKVFFVDLALNPVISPDEEYEWHSNVQNMFVDCRSSIMSQTASVSVSGRPFDGIEETNPPTFLPTSTPPTFEPTESPSESPTEPQPTSYPTGAPSVAVGSPTMPPVTKNPSAKPTTRAPVSSKPTRVPTDAPTKQPTAAPSAEPSSFKPTLAPSAAPSIKKTSVPTTSPTVKPSAEPTIEPSQEPTSWPTKEEDGEDSTHLSSNFIILIAVGSGAFFTLAVLALSFGIRKYSGGLQKIHPPPALKLPEEAKGFDDLEKGDSRTSTKKPRAWSPFFDGKDGKIYAEDSETKSEHKENDAGGSVSSSEAEESYFDLEDDVSSLDSSAASEKSGPTIR